MRSCAWPESRLPSCLLEEWGWHHQPIFLRDEVGRLRTLFQIACPIGITLQGGAPTFTVSSVFKSPDVGVTVDVARFGLQVNQRLTQMAALPPGSSRDLADPFAEKKSRLPFFLTVLVIIVAGAAGLWAAGIITVPGL